MKKKRKNKISRIIFAAYIAGALVIIAGIYQVVAMSIDSLHAPPIIGSTECVPVARKAIGLLIEGSTHSSVYKWLEKQRRSMKKREFLGDTEK